MAKRANPYTEDFIPQSKVYVGIKQFNNNEERIHKVYEKTLKLLFTGAKKGSTPQNVIEDSVTTCNRKDNFKQLFIGKDGSLLHSGKVKPDGITSAPNQCNCGVAADSKCWYCEKSLCPACQHHCGRCNHFYCTHCSLIGSDATEVCVSCFN